MTERPNNKNRFIGGNCGFEYYDSYIPYRGLTRHYTINYDLTSSEEECKQWFLDDFDAWANENGYSDDVATSNALYIFSIIYAVVCWLSLFSSIAKAKRMEMVPRNYKLFMLFLFVSPIVVFICVNFSGSGVNNSEVYYKWMVDIESRKDTWPKITGITYPEENLADAFGSTPAPYTLDKNDPVLPQVPERPGETQPEQTEEPPEQTQEPPEQTEEPPGPLPENQLQADYPDYKNLERRTAYIIDAGNSGFIWPFIIGIFLIFLMIYVRKFYKQAITSFMDKRTLDSSLGVFIFVIHLLITWFYWLSVFVSSAIMGDPKIQAYQDYLKYKYEYSEEPTGTDIDNSQCLELEESLTKLFTVLTTMHALIAGTVGTVLVLGFLSEFVSDDISKKIKDQREALIGISMLAVICVGCPSGYIAGVTSAQTPVQLKCQYIN